MGALIFLLPHILLSLHSQKVEPVKESPSPWIQVSPWPLLQWNEVEKRLCDFQGEVLKVKQLLPASLSSSLSPVSLLILSPFSTPLSLISSLSFLLSLPHCPFLFHAACKRSEDSSAVPASNVWGLPESWALADYNLLPFLWMLRQSRDNLSQWNTT